MAHKKAGGSTRNGRNSNPQYRGIKVHGGTKVKTGMIIVRQVGSSFHCGANVGLGKDYTLFALTDGHVRFSVKGRRAYKKKFVHVDPISSYNALSA